MRKLVKLYTFLTTKSFVFFVILMNFGKRLIFNVLKK